MFRKKTVININSWLNIEVDKLGRITAVATVKHRKHGGDMKWTRHKIYNLANRAEIYPFKLVHLSSDELLNMDHGFTRVHRFKIKRIKDGRA